MLWFNAFFMPMKHSVLIITFDMFLFFYFVSIKVIASNVSAIFNFILKNSIHSNVNKRRVVAASVANQKR